MPTLTTEWIVLFNLINAAYINLFIDFIAPFLWLKPKLKGPKKIRMGLAGAGIVFCNCVISFIAMWVVAKAPVFSAVIALGLPVSIYFLIRKKILFSLIACKVVEAFAILLAFTGGWVSL